MKFFKHVANVSKKKNPKKHDYFEFFFNKKMSLLSIAALFFAGPKNDFYEFECLCLAITL